MLQASGIVAAMPRRHIVLFWLGVLGHGLLAGCAGFRSPAVTVDDVAITEATDEALALAFSMELRNPNTLPLELYEFRYTLLVNGREVYAGRHAGGATLSASGQRHMTIPAVIPYKDLGWEAAQLPPAARYALWGKLQYNAPDNLAQILFDAGVRRPKVAFSKEGELRLR